MNMETVSELRFRLHFLFLCLCFHRGVTKYEKCNSTIESRTHPDAENYTVTVSITNIANGDRGKELYCWYKFVATAEEMIQVNLKKYRVGHYHKDKKRCEGGYLRISEETSCSAQPDWLPPNTFCGNGDNTGIKRYMKGSVAFVEFKLGKAKHTNEFEVEVIFYNKDKLPKKLPYGHLRRKEDYIENTKCDWLVPVTSCYGYCAITSPGYPGIYSPHTRCRYQLVNFDDGRVELKFSGAGFKVKFDVKKSPNCTEDYIEVYDGATTGSPLIGRFCGHDGIHAISSGPELLMIFQTDSGGPPWDYSGFTMEAVDRWRHGQDGGKKVEGKTCDWHFNSLDKKEGSSHTPDHLLQEVTTCDYIFCGQPNERVAIEFSIKKLGPACTEYIEVFEAETNKTLKKICGGDIRQGKENTVKLTSNTYNTVVRYFNENGQQSNLDPIWIDYQFVKADIAWKKSHATRSKGCSTGSCPAAIGTDPTSSAPVFGGHLSTSMVTWTPLGLVLGRWLT